MASGPAGVVLVPCAWDSTSRVLCPHPLHFWWSLKTRFRQPLTLGTRCPIFALPCRCPLLLRRSQARCAVPTALDSNAPCHTMDVPCPSGTLHCGSGMSCPSLPPTGEFQGGGRAQEMSQKARENYGTDLKNNSFPTKVMLLRLFPRTFRNAFCHDGVHSLSQMCQRLKEIVGSGRQPPAPPNLRPWMLGPRNDLVFPPPLLSPASPLSTHLKRMPTLTFCRHHFILALLVSCRLPHLRQQSTTMQLFPRSHAYSHSSPANPMHCRSSRGRGKRMRRGLPPGCALPLPNRCNWAPLGHCRPKNWCCNSEGGVMGRAAGPGTAGTLHPRNLSAIHIRVQFSSFKVGLAHVCVT